MTADHHEAERRDPAQRKEDEPRQRNHGPTDRPDDDAHRKTVIKVELPAQAAHPGQFQQHKPQPARQQKARQLRLRFAPRRGKKCACSREKNEDRRAEMRNPAREEQRRIGPVQLRRFKCEVARKIMARVVQRHEDHHQSPQRIHGIESGAGKTLGRLSAGGRAGFHSNVC